MPRAKKTNGNGGGALAHVEEDARRPRAGFRGAMTPEDTLSPEDMEPDARAGMTKRDVAAARNEVEAMASMQATLLRLEPDARERVMAWLQAFHRSLAD